jgi:hypothetical protein
LAASHEQLTTPLPLFARQLLLYTVGLAPALSIKANIPCTCVHNLATTFRPGMLSYLHPTMVPFGKASQAWMETCDGFRCSLLQCRPMSDIQW